MTKNSTILTVSIPKEQEEFLINQNISPSALIQDAIMAKWAIVREFQEGKEKIIKQLTYQCTENAKLLEFLELNKLDEMYLKWRGTNVLAKE